MRIPSFLDFVPAGFQSGQKYILPVADLFLPQAGHTRIWLRGIPLSLDCSFPNERLIRFCGENILRKYARSRLGRLLTRLSGVGERRFVDVGAHMGFYSIWARHCGFSCTLIEPEEDAFHFLAANPQIGTAFAVALADHDGEMPFLRSKTGASSSLVGSAGPLAQAASVPVRRAGDFLLQHIPDPNEIELLKIDVEGAECLVLGGLSSLLARVRPLIWCEVRGALSRRAPNTCERAVACMTGFDYEPLLPRSDGYFEPLSRREAARRGVFDLLFVPGNDRRRPLLGFVPGA